MVDESIYSSLSKERKELQKKGEAPEWYTTGAYQAYTDRYQYKDETPKGAFQRLAKTGAQYAPKSIRKDLEESYFRLFWEGKLAPSSPVLANMGTDRGLPVSCAGNYVEDSIEGFYTRRKECAILTKHGFGTSSYLGDIRPRGSAISKGGTASGILPVLKGFVKDSDDVSQSGIRRGSWAGYMDIEHGDFWEIVGHLQHLPDSVNIGWIITDKFIAKLNKGDPEAIARYQRSLKVKCLTGKGYYFFVDKVNRMNPQCYKDLGLVVKASNLCSEVMLHSDSDNTFVCVLSSLNLSRWDQITDLDIRHSMYFLDGVCEDFIQKGSHINGLQESVNSAVRGRALGLGTLGFHTYLQSKGLSMGSMETHMLNNQMFKRIHDQTLIASQKLAEIYGEPEWCKGHGIRNTHRTAIAPNMTSSILCGGVSQGIEPVMSNAFTQKTAAGQMERINPVFLNLAKERGKYTPDMIQNVAYNKGSVQHLDWLSEEEKNVFKTAYEIDQFVLLRLASVRQQHICQAQSLNLFTSADEDEEYISKLHKQAFLDKNIKSLYYLRSEAGITASKGECESCSG